MNRVRLWLLILVVVPIMVSGCGQQTLLSNVTASTDQISPNGDGTDDAMSISYLIGQPAVVSIALRSADGQTYTLRDQQTRVASSDPYTMIFDGTVTGTAPDVQQQIIPDGSYTWTLTATPQAGGAPQERSGTLRVENAASQLPKIQNLNVTSEFSPNEDADNDVAYFNYSLPMTATVSIDITPPTGEPFPFINQQEGPFEQVHVWDGKRPDGSLVSSGTYTYTITAQDDLRNTVRETGTIQVDQPGRSEARISFAQIAPVELALGQPITVTLRVKNTGDVPIRTYGPASGYAYESTNVSFSSIEDQKYAERGGGPWRVGLDWGGGHGFPFRWALSPRPPEQWAQPGEYDYLQPGEEAEITGSVVVDQREDRMQFYVGLIHEGVGYPQNNVQRTLVCVGIPNGQGRCPRDAQP